MASTARKTASKSFARLREEPLRTGRRRSLYATKDFGIVKASEVYYRRGSSSAIASPADVYQMGLDDEKQFKAIPVILIELADLKRRVTLGTSVKLDTINHEQHNRADYPEERSEDRGFLSSISNDVNENYWRELADYTLATRSLAAIGLAATNKSAELARKVRLEISQAKDSGVRLVEDLPDFPRHNRTAFFVPPVSLHSMINPPKGALTLLDHNDRWTLTIDFGDIQPKATSWAANPLYVSANSAGSYSLAVKIYADNLGEPQEAEIQLDFSIEQRPRLTLGDLRQVQDEYWEQKEKELDDY